jgi:hypothetical protein
MDISVFDIAPISPIAAVSATNFDEMRGKGFSSDQGRQEFFYYFFLLFKQKERERSFAIVTNMLFHLPTTPIIAYYVTYG